MYRTNDPRFRRRLNEIGQTVERANEQAQSNLYIFGTHYIQPCLDSVSACLTTCVDASCPSLNLRQRERLYRRRGRSRGRAERNFDFYDDWDEDETDGLLGWGGGEDFDRLIVADGGGGGYGTVTSPGAQTTQPARQKGMAYPKGRRKSAGLINEERALDPTVIAGPSFFGKLFGGKALRYKPSAADLQEHPGTRRLGRDLTEGEALLEESETSEYGGKRGGRKHQRARSGTVGSSATMDSLSSRGDIFPSDEEDDAIPLDDEFAMVLERRTTQSGGGQETESSSNKTKSERNVNAKRSKRPSAGSRTSTRRSTTLSMRSRGSGSSGRKTMSRRSSSVAAAPIEDIEAEVVEEEEGEHEAINIPTLSELKREEATIAEQEEAEVERKREEAKKLAAERGLVEAGSSKEEANASKRSQPPPPSSGAERAEPSQLPTPLPTDDEEDAMAAAQLQGSATSSPASPSTAREDGNEGPPH